jgi:hypothetical protein
MAKQNDRHHLEEILPDSSLAASAEAAASQDGISLDAYIERLVSKDVQERNRRAWGELSNPIIREVGRRFEARYPEMPVGDLLRKTHNSIQSALRKGRKSVAGVDLSSLHAFKPL